MGLAASCSLLIQPLLHGPQTTLSLRLRMSPACRFKSDSRANTLSPTIVLLPVVWKWSVAFRGRKRFSQSGQRCSLVRPGWSQKIHRPDGAAVAIPEALNYGQQGRWCLEQSAASSTGPLGRRGRKSARTKSAVCCEAVRQHDRLHTTVAAGGEQFERAAAVGLGAAARSRHWRVSVRRLFRIARHAIRKARPAAGCRRSARAAPPGYNASPTSGTCVPSGNTRPRRPEGRRRLSGGVLGVADVEPLRRDRVQVGRAVRHAQSFIRGYPAAARNQRSPCAATISGNGDRNDPLMAPVGADL